MNQDKMYLINKLFNNKEIRTIRNKDDEKYYISVVDIEGMFRVVKSIPLKKGCIENG